MSAPGRIPLVAVKLTPVGRAQTYLAGDTWVPLGRTTYQIRVSGRAEPVPARPSLQTPIRDR